MKPFAAAVTVLGAFFATAAVPSPLTNSTPASISRSRSPASSSSIDGVYHTE